MNDLPVSLPDELPPLPELPDLPAIETAAPTGELAARSDKLDRLLREPGLADWAAALLKELAGRFGTRAASLILPAFSCAGGELVVPHYMGRDQREAAWLRRFLTSPEVNPVVQETWLSSGFLADDPPWLTELLEREEAQVARTFLLGGNTADYAFDPAKGYRAAGRLLLDTLAHVKDLVVTFSLAGGIALYPPDPLGQAEADEARMRLAKVLKLGGWDLSKALIGQVCQQLDALTRWLEETSLPRGAAVVFENVHLLIPSGGAELERNFLVDRLLTWSVSPRIFHSPHCLILTADFLEDVSNELRARGGKIDQLTIPRPSDPAIRLKFLLALLEPHSEMIETRAARLRQGLRLGGYQGDYVAQLRQLAHDTAGLTLLGIEDIVQQAAFDRQHRLDGKQVMAAKRERLQQESDGLLEVIDPHRTLDDLAGYPELKDRMRQVIASLKNPNALRDIIPMGILFLGPPGTGKTVAAEAIAGSSGINMARLGNFRGMYVGQSERNLSRLLGLIESLHPVIVFMDELDQSEASRGEGGDSGVSKRIFGKLLQFMSDTTHRGEILWIGASNRPDLIDAALKRAGRFDLVLPFLLPDAPSRAKIFALVVGKRLRDAPRLRDGLSAEDFEQLARETEGFSGAEIEALTAEVLRRAELDLHAGMEQLEVTLARFEAVRAMYLPPAGREYYRSMEDLALAEVAFLDLLPPEQAQRRRELTQQSLAGAGRRAAV